MDTIKLNETLIAEQGLSLFAVAKIRQLHRRRKAIVGTMEETEKSDLKRLAAMITKIDFKLQKLWGFPYNANFHRFWLLPGCECPKVDNEERYGTKYFIFVDNCLIHGSAA